MLGLLLGGFLLGPVARAEEAERFRLISAAGVEELRERLGQASTGSYRIAGAAEGTAISGGNRIAVLLEHVPGGGYHHAVATSRGPMDEAAEGRPVNEWAAEGYRLSAETVLAGPAGDWWLPDAAEERTAVFLLERGPEARPHEYVAMTFQGEKRFDRDLGHWTPEGFRPVAVWNRGRSLAIVLERPVPGGGGVPPGATSAQATAGDYVVHVGVIRNSTRGKLKEWAADGYRIVDIADASIRTPPIVLLRLEAEADWSSRLLYEADRKVHNEKLEKKLNKRGRKGFRIAAGTLTDQIVGLERPPHQGEPPAQVQYRTLSSRTAPGIPLALERAADEGFEVVALVVNADEILAVVQRDAPRTTIGR